jgi:Methyltransferase domain
MDSTDLVHKLTRIPDKLAGIPERVEHLVKATVADPREVALYLPEVLSERFARPVGYVIEEDWEARLHKALGAPWPCPEGEAAQELWDQIVAEMEATSLDFGRWTYGPFSDGDPALARATWCSVRHLEPKVVVETGVARGVTTRFILEALERNGHGHLWSIDLPHLFDSTIHDQIGAAVPADRRNRWTYIKGSSRRRLPGLLAGLGSVGVFVHDSLHTARNMRFEMEAIWQVLSPGGVMLIDDVYNQSFREFVDGAKACDAMVARSGDGRTDATCPSDLCWAFGIANKVIDLT